jgi:hypothetical protein
MASRDATITLLIKANAMQLRCHRASREGSWSEVIAVARKIGSCLRGWA